jgi:hypothetical protein
MINGTHAILYSDDADATRAALAKVLGTRSVDAGGGWLIFALRPAGRPRPPSATDGGRAEPYLLCDGVAATVAALRAEGGRGRPAGQRPGLGPADSHHPARRGRARPLPAPPPNRGAAELSSTCSRA